jgi:two-component system, NarL family, sensor kinase
MKDDSSKVIFLLNKVNEYYRSHGRSNEAITYIEQAKDLAEKLNYHVAIVQSHICLADAYNSLGNYDKGLFHLNIAITTIKKSSYKPSQLAAIYFNLGNTNELKGELPEALVNFFKAISILDENKTSIDYHSGTGSIYQNIGIVYKKNKQYNKSIQYLNKALDHYKQVKDTARFSGIYTNIGNAYFEMHNYKIALKFYKKGLDYGEKMKSQKSICTSIAGIGNVYQNIGELDKALSYHTRSLDIAIKNKLKRYEVIANMNIGIVYQLKKEFEKSLIYLNKSLNISKEMGSLDLSKEVYSNLSKYYEAQDSDSKALESLKKENELNDSIFNDKNAKQINELSVKFETEKKEKEIIVLNANLLSKKKDEIILQAKIQKRNAIILGTIIGSVLLMITITLLYTRKRLLLKNLHQLEINQQRDYTTASIVQAQEKEQTRIAKDLHDSIGTFLSTLKINLQLYEDAIPIDKTEGYQNALNLIDKISIELRNIMKNLASETLQEHGLVKGYEELVQRINELEIIEVAFHTNGLTERLNEVTEHNLYRIAQELLNNCIKHSKAQNATIQLINDDKTITLMFEDDGMGFDVDSPLLKNKNHGMGLKNIYNRVEFIKGTIHIESSAENGSSFIIEVPKK